MHREENVNEVVYLGVNLVQVEEWIGVGQNN